MKAVYIKEFGGVEGLEIREVADPAPPAADQISIRVRAAGLNRADLLQRRGLYPPPSGYSPDIPGLEFAGEVEAVGESVTNFTIGDRVFGITAGEAQAEKLVVDARLAASIPQSLSFIEAAAFPEAFITAFDAILTQAGSQAGESLLIHAVGSGVGLAALQLAREFGVATFGTSRSAEKLEKCVSFGLNHPVLSFDGRFADAVLELTEDRGVDVILDLVGGTYFEENIKVLAPKGRLMLVGLTGGRSSSIDMGAVLQKRLTIKGSVLRSRSTDEKAQAVEEFGEKVVPLIQDGRLLPNIDRVFSVSAVAEAHRYLESNESFGKVILEF